MYAAEPDRGWSVVTVAAIARVDGDAESATLFSGVTGASYGDDGISVLWGRLGDASAVPILTGLTVHKPWWAAQPGEREASAEGWQRVGRRAQGAGPHSPSRSGCG